MGATLTVLAEISHAAAPVAQRAVGALAVSSRRVAGQDRLDDLRQEGSLKVLFPRPAPGGPLEAVVLNTSGGMTGGDRMRIAAAAGAGSRLVVSSQAAERAYRAVEGPAARLDVTLRAAEGASLHWLPQETILFDGAALERCLTLEVAPGAVALVVEPVIMGRAAMGEEVRAARLADRWSLRRAGELVFADAVRFQADPVALMDRPGAGAGARAWASVLFVGPGAEAALADVRALLPVAAGASVIRPGVLFARLLAADGFALRAALIPVIERLSGAGIPKVWRL